MKSYKLNKTLENSTYPLEQELKNLNRASQTNTVKTIITVSTVVFSGIATSFIYENNLFDSALEEINKNISLERFFFYVLAAIYGMCVIINLVIYFVNKHKEKPKILKKSGYGRKKLSEVFHKSIINDIVVGLSFVDKSEDESQENSQPEKQVVLCMYLYEATYYFIQAEEQIEQMELFDDTKQKYNNDLVDEIGKETLLTTLIVFKNGVGTILDKIEKLGKNTIVEYIELQEIYEKLQIHINLL